MYFSTTAFAAATGYFPVKTEALKEEYMLQAVEEEQEYTSAALNNSITTTIDMLKSYYLYGYPAFEHSYELRELLDAHLYEWVKRDMASLEGLEQSAYEARRQELLASANFEQWYAAFIETVQQTTAPIVGDER